MRTRAKVFKRKGQLQQALEDIESACRRAPHDASTHLQCAEVLAKLSRSSDAMRELRKALDLDSDLGYNDLSAAGVVRQSVYESTNDVSLLKKAKEDFYRARELATTRKSLEFCNFRIQRSTCYTQSLLLLHTNTTLALLRVSHKTAFGAPR